MDAPEGGPWVHRILSASSADGLVWTRDEGVRWEHASVPCAVADADRVLLYAVDADRGPGQPESAGVAVSTDGLTFERRTLSIEGMTVRKALDPGVVRDPAGGYRLYYLGSDADGDPAAAEGDHEIHLARSGDGITFREDRVAYRRPHLVDPDVFPWRGVWFCYVFGGRRTEIAASRDGTSFRYLFDLDPPGYGTVAPVALDDGRLRLYAFEQGTPAGNAFVSLVSSDGLTWTREAGVRLRAARDEQITDPSVVRWKGGWKMYFKSEPGRAGRPGPGMPGAGLGPVAPPARAREVGSRADRRRAGPWDHDVVVTRLAAEGDLVPLATFARAGVPTLARLADGRLLAAHQHFPEDDDASFDRVAVRTSRDEGRTWDAPRTIRVEGLPEGMRSPFDPTLVPLPDGRVRLYFTGAFPRGGPGGASPPAIHSAVSTDGVTWVYEDGVRFAVEGRPVIDAAVALHRGVFHLYAPDDGGARPVGEDAGPAPAGGTGYHATSEDGLRFTRQADVRVGDRMRWLGNAQSDGRSITFLGTADPGLWMATSEDGATWAPPVVWPRARLADPGFVRLADGTWLVAGTGPRRDERPAPRAPR